MILGMTLRAVLFDYGGTLDGEGSHWLDRFAGLYRAAGVQRPFAEIKQAFYAADEAAYGDPRVGSMSLDDLIEFHVGAQLAGLGIEEPRLRQQLVDGFVESTRSALRDSRAQLSRLSPAYRLGVVSNFYGNVGRILSDHDFDPLLSVVADSNVVGAAKPDARIFDYALAELGAAPGETLHVGDSYERDVEAAHRIGLRAVWLTVDGQRGPPSGCGVAEARVSSLAELVARLLGEPNAPSDVRA
jgi:putative hydrolase of the HAD superfamily